MCVCREREKVRKDEGKERKERKDPRLLQTQVGVSSLAPTCLFTELALRTGAAVPGVPSLAVCTGSADDGSGF